MPGFDLSAAVSVEWGKDPVTWDIEDSQGNKFYFLLEADPELDEDVSIEDDGWQEAVARQVVESIPPRWAGWEDSAGTGLSGRDVFRTVFAEHIKRVNAKASLVRQMLEYLAEEREKAMKSASKVASKNVAGRPTARR